MKFPEQVKLIKSTKQVHSTWYRQTYPEIAELGLDPATHYLRYGAAMGRNPGKNFDARFYLETYPDAAESGLNPLVHYALHGQAKGYATRPKREDPRNQINVICTKLLSLGFTERPLAEFTEIAMTSYNSEARALAARELALWHMCAKTEADYRMALDWIARARLDAPNLDFRAKLSTVELLCHYHLNDRTAGLDAYERAALSGEATSDLTLARVNFEQNPKARVLWINQVLARYEIEPVMLLPDEGQPAYNRLTCAVDLPKVTDGPKVTVLIATYEAAEMLPTALRSLQEQTWQNLEIIVLDDCSLTPDTMRVAEEFAAHDSRIQVVRMKQHNEAHSHRLDIATGEFVYLSSSKNWTHPVVVENLIKSRLSDNSHVVAALNLNAELSISDSLIKTHTIDDVFFELNDVSKNGCSKKLYMNLQDTLQPKKELFIITTIKVTEDKDENNTELFGSHQMSTTGFGVSEKIYAPAILDQIYAQGVIPSTEPIEYQELVSIIIPSYNNAPYLGSAINSALSQIGVNIEVIVVDDGSDDTSLRVAAEARERDDRVRVIPLLRNFGCYYARNTGVIQARGEFICFLDSDDIMHPERVLQQIRALQDTPSAMACQSKARRWTVKFDHPLREIKYVENTLFIRREVFEKMGYFDTVQYSGDAEFRRRMRKAFENPIVRIEDELYFLRTLDTSLTMRPKSQVFQKNGDTLNVNLSPARKAYEQAFSAWQDECAGKSEKLYIPFPQRSRPFDLFDSTQNASPSLGETVIGKMASYPPREAILRKALPTILPQLDRLVIYLNGYDRVPDFLQQDKIEVVLANDAKGDLRDNGKFFKLRDVQGYIFTLDDDIAYPPDYVGRMIYYIEMFQRSCVIGVHGAVYPREKLGYMEGRKVLPFWEKNDGRFVDVIGTGTVAFHSSTVDLDLSDFKTTGVCDLWFARACHMQGVPLLAIPRVKRWMQEIEGTRDGRRLYDEAIELEEKHTRLYHEHLYPVLRRHAPSIRASEALVRLIGKIKIDLLDIRLPEDLPLPPETHKIVASPSPSPVLVQYHTRDRTVPTEAEYINLHVVVNGWNCKEFVKPCLRSLINQKPGHYVAQFTLIDDGSTDGTFEELTSSGLLPTARIIRNTENYGPAYTRHVGITQIIDPETVVVLVDLDDELKPDALQKVAERYLKNPDCLMTIGNWISQRRKNPHPFYSAQTLDEQRVRNIDEFYATHLRSFRRKLYDAIKVEDLQEPEGAWFQTCTDVAIMFPLLDQCYARNVEFIDTPIYFYNEKHGLSTLDRFGKPYKRERYEWIRQKSRKPRFEDKKNTVLAAPLVVQPKLTDTAPVLIVGNPRSGTRMCANVLHQHPDICVTEEMLNLPRLEEVLNVAQSRYLEKFLPAHPVQMRKELLVKMLWTLRSGDNIVDRFRTASHVVNKTPRLEHRFDMLEEMFQTTPPKYVYCVRDAFGVLKSVKNLPNLTWNKNTVAENLEHYLSSLRQYEHMQKAAGDRIVMINIATLNEAPSNFSVYKKVFSLMEIRDVPDWIQGRINDMGAQNSMQRVHEKTNRISDIIELTDEEIATVEKNSEYQRFSGLYGLKKTM